MESLLSLSFDYLTSCNSDKVRKGLKQLEGLLAQICLSKGSTTLGHVKRHSVAVVPSQPSRTPTPPRELSQLSNDPAFREFFKLQEGFEFNVAMRLIGCLDRLLGKNSDDIALLVKSTLSVLHGVLLLHPPSRSLFARTTNMDLLLDLLSPSTLQSPAVQAQTLLVLVTALLDNPACTRTFESMEGLLTVTTVARDTESSREVKMKCMSFLYFYLMPETPWGWTTNDGDETEVWDEEKANSMTRSMRDKQQLLANHINNVDELVEDLMQSQEFGGILAGA